MYGFLLVALGGAFGASLRYGIGLSAMRLLPEGWPWGTFIVNSLGSLLMGLVAGWLIARHISLQGPAGLFLLTGLLGGFTTFSAISLETAQMLRSETFLKAAAYTGSTLALGVSALFLGLWIATHIYQQGTV